MTEVSCPVCKSDSYLNPNIVILVSPCFHKLCEQCVYKIFAHGYAPCPQCQTPLRRINYIASTFEDIEVEREIKIRRMLSRSFTRTEEEFENIVEFNDYLEEYENLVFELMELKNDAQIKEKIANIKNSNSILIPKLPQVYRKESPEQNIVKPITENTDTLETIEQKDYKALIDDKIKIPENLMFEYRPGGFVHETMVDILIFSVFGAVNI